MPQPLPIETKESLHRGVSPISVALWLLLMILIGMLIWRLISPCGIRFPDGRPLLAACDTPAAAISAQAATDLRRSALEDEVRRLEVALMQVPPCPHLIPAVLPPADVTEPAPPPEPAPPEPPPPEPAPPPEPPPPPPDIPQDAWTRRDVSFLDGCWDLQTDYRLQDRNTRRVTKVNSWTMCFDGNGNGRQTLILSDGKRCEGGVSGSFTGAGLLRLADPGRIPCSGSMFIYQRLIDCRRVQSGIAECRARQPETGSETNATFRRRSGQ